MRLGFLITNYKSTALAKDAVSAIRKQEPLARVVVVDDGTPLSSEDVRWFQSSGDSVTVIQNERNLGYCASVNIGFRALDDCDIVFVHDSDAVLTMPLSDRLRREADCHPDVGIWGFKLIDHHARATGNSSLSRIPADLLFGRFAGSLQHVRFLRFLFPDRALAIHSCAMATRRDVWVRLGGLDETFRFLEADIDFCYRAAKDLGVRADILSDIVVVHEGGAFQLENSRRMVVWHWSALRFLRKHGLIKAPRLLKTALVGRHTVEFVIAVLGGRFLWQDKLVRADRIRTRWLLLAGVFNDYERDGKLG